MWRYSQSTGLLTRDDVAGVSYGPGYSGNGDGLNNPAMQDVRDQGPVPQGRYRVLAPVDTVAHGPFFLALEPSPANQMFGRSGFGIHGDRKDAVGQFLASNGCIILPPHVRDVIWQSNDHELEVVA